MTVADLIRALQEYPRDTQVLVNGYEGGYDDAHQVHTAEVVLVPDGPDYMGDYATAKPGDAAVLKVVVVS